MAIKSIAPLRQKSKQKHEIIIELIEGKKVVHYGCVDDDEELIEHKAQKGYYLHQAVTEHSKSTIGIDLNKDAFNFLEEEMGIINVVYGNVEDPGTFNLDKKRLKKAEVVLIPDLIEHLNNPGNMLQGIKDHFREDVKVIILTPNPFAWYNFAATLLNKEIYTPYHTCYFTTESMIVLLKRYGFKVDKIHPVIAPKRRGGIVRAFDASVGKLATFISPGFADLYLYECSLE